jgi:hypothetical protein
MKMDGSLNRRMTANANSCKISLPLKPTKILLVMNIEGLYVKANPNFQGAVSVPLLWDTKTNAVVSNSSLGLAEMIEAQIKPTLVTRNHDMELFPIDEAEKKEHLNFCKLLHTNVTTALYRMNATKDGAKHDEMVEEYYKALHEMEDRLKHHDENGHPNTFLFGPNLRFCDMEFHCCDWIWPINGALVLASTTFGKTSSILAYSIVSPPYGIRRPCFVPYYYS